MNWSRAVSGCMALGAAGLLAACGSSGSSTDAAKSSTGNGGKAKVLSIGFPYAATGPYATFDVGVLNGMQYAAKKLNAANGPVTFKIVAQDNGSTPQTASTVTQSMLGQGVRSFVMSTVGANVAMGLQMSKAGAVIEMGMVAAPSVRQAIGQRAVSLAEPLLNVQASAVAKYACDKGYRNVWTLGSPDLGYTQVGSKYFADAFAHYCGGKIAGTGTYKIGATDYGTQIEKIPASADAIFSPIFVPDSIAFAKQLRSSGNKLPFLSTDGQDAPAYAKAGGSAVEGSVFATAAFPTPGSPLAAFFADFKRATGAAPTSNEFEAVGRDAVYAYADAVKNAGGDTSPDAILAGFKQIKDLPLVTGNATMGSDNVAIKPVALVQIKDGKPTQLSFKVPPYTPAP